MKKKIVVITFLMALVVVIIYLYNGHPLVLNKNQQEVVTIQDVNTKEFNPINNIDFSTGNNVAYLVFSKQDEKELPKEMPKYRLLECTDNAVLESMKNSFSFNRSGGDMATCESKLLIYRDNKLVFHSDFVISDNAIGMQNSVVGWAEPTDGEELRKALLKFKPARKLFINLN